MKSRMVQTGQSFGMIACVVLISLAFIRSPISAFSMGTQYRHKTNGDIGFSRRTFVPSLSSLAMSSTSTAASTSSSSPSSSSSFIYTNSNDWLNYEMTVSDTASSIIANENNVLLQNQQQVLKSVILQPASNKIQQPPPHKGLSPLELPNKRTAISQNERLMMSMEMMIGRISMITAIVLFITEISTGRSFPDQLSNFLP